jgi:hypothetical protein
MTKRTKMLSYLRIALCALGLSSALMLTCVQCAQGQHVDSTYTLAPQSNEAAIAIQWHARCFLSKLGLIPRWDVHISVISDPTFEWYGRTLTRAGALEATSIFNLYTIQRDHEDMRLIALHEAMHVALGELVQLAATADRDMTSIESERLVRQMVRWPSWAGVCTA